MSYRNFCNSLIRKIFISDKDEEYVGLQCRYVGDCSLWMQMVEQLKKKLLSLEHVHGTYTTRPLYVMIASVDGHVALYPFSSIDFHILPCAGLILNKC